MFYFLKLEREGVECFLLPLPPPTARSSLSRTHTLLLPQLHVCLGFCKKDSPGCRTYLDGSFTSISPLHFAWLALGIRPHKLGKQIQRDAIYRPTVGYCRGQQMYCNGQLSSMLSTWPRLSQAPCQEPTQVSPYHLEPVQECCGFSLKTLSLWYLTTYFQQLVSLRLSHIKANTKYNRSFSIPGPRRLTRYLLTSCRRKKTTQINHWSSKGSGSFRCS